MNKNIALKKMITAAHFKIFLNYSQSLTIINTLHLNWENILSNFFNIQKTVSGGLHQVVRMECLINSNIILKFIGIFVNRYL